MVTDPSQPLKNSRHEVFARALASGKSGAEAARVAGYTKERARKTASEFGTNRDISDRVEWLQRQAAKGTVLSIQEKREYLALVVRTPLAKVDENSVLCQSAKYTEDGIEIKMADKLKAISLDNDLAGEGAEAKAMGAAADALAVIKVLTHGKE